MKFILTLKIVEWLIPKLVYTILKTSAILAMSFEKLDDFQILEFQNFSFSIVLLEKFMRSFSSVTFDAADSQSRQIVIKNSIGYKFSSTKHSGFSILCPMIQ